MRPPCRCHGSCQHTPCPHAPSSPHQHTARLHNVPWFQKVPPCVLQSPYPGTPSHPCQQVAASPLFHKVLHYHAHYREPCQCGRDPCHRHVCPQTPCAPPCQALGKACPHCQHRTASHPCRHRASPPCGGKASPCHWLAACSHSLSSPPGN